MLDEQTLEKLGLMDRSEEGALLLVNRRDQAFVVDEATAFIWNLANGTTLAEVKRILEDKLEGGYHGFEEELLRLLEILMKCGLLELS
ncbi:MAG: hypothetical protein HYY22_01585 [Thaumarchaeota archaeon]|nr:hypothetical protein [Nitrososphaerota archaeon]